LGGVDAKGPQLFSMAPHGSCSFLPYATMGSGSLAAMSIFEAKYKDNLNEEEAKDIVKEAIEAGIIHDEGSGSNVDICVIKKDKVDYFRPYKSDNKRIGEPYPYEFPKNNTPFIREVSFKIEKHELVKIEVPEKMMIE